jgi:hypothetical protein
MPTIPLLPTTVVVILYTNTALYPNTVAKFMHDIDHRFVQSLEVLNQPFSLTYQLQHTHQGEILRPRVRSFI